MSRCQKQPSFLESVSQGTKAANPAIFGAPGCPTSLLECIDRQTPVQEPDSGKAPQKKLRIAKGMNKTERHYLANVLIGKDARFEALTFRMANNHRYTPDFVVFEAGRPSECHEVKGSYALHSQQRARLAFDQAAVEFPGLRWIWAVKSKGGWRVG